MSTNNTITLHRVLSTSPEKVYRAFTEAAAIAAWLPPYGYVCTVQEHNPQVGGRYRMTFQNFTTQQSHSFGGAFLQLVPGELVQYSDTFDNPAMPGEMTTTIRISKGAMGTELRITQEGLPTMIPVEACYMGWQQSLEKLARLVEPDIKGM